MAKTLKITYNTTKDAVQNKKDAFGKIFKRAEPIL